MGELLSTVGEEKAHNPRLMLQMSKDDFVAHMNQLNLSYPRYISTMHYPQIKHVVCLVTVLRLA